MFLAHSAFSTRHSSDFSTHMSGKHGQTLAEYSRVYGRSMTHRVSQISFFPASVTE